MTSLALHFILMILTMTTLATAPEAVMVQPFHTVITLVIAVCFAIVIAMDLINMHESKEANEPVELDDKRTVYYLNMMLEPTATTAFAAWAIQVKYHETREDAVAAAQALGYKSCK